MLSWFAGKQSAKRPTVSSKPGDPGDEVGSLTFAPWTNSLRCLRFAFSIPIFSGFGAGYIMGNSYAIF